MENKKSGNFKFAVILSVSIALVCVALFLFLMIKYLAAKSFKIDESLINFSKDIRSSGLTAFFKVLTHFGSMITVAILAVIMAIVCKPIWVKIFAVINVGFVAVFCFVVKHIVNRPRPFGVALIEETGYSFPSAHTMGSIVFYGFLIFLIWKYLKNKSLNVVLTIFLSAFALLIGYTRIYLGVHYTTDVLAAIFAGIAYLSVAILLFNILEHKVKFKRGNHEKE